MRETLAQERLRLEQMPFKEVDVKAALDQIQRRAIATAGAQGRPVRSQGP
jgi:hypothetical protein